ncbi:NAD+ synthase [Maritalea porphyrae]|uniref:NAD+ synthase n=1 Tax=Maritalea porphyrae TaxID=880732 RepID=UPI0022AE5433|nr:NAD+ synthase [Maritalea porphyrae]MCZ4271022.1 NAD+ synthase [Maritalea porphyrae]
MTDKLRIALAQLNPTVGALSVNFEKGKRALAEAIDAGADIILYPELFITGYFPEDLLFKPKFVADAMETACELAELTKGEHIAALIPCVWRESDKLFNAVLLAKDGKIVDWRAKYELPNDDVFYEKRYFEQGPLPGPFNIHDVRIGVPICEDIWWPEVCECLAETGAEMLLCPNGSPYWRNKQDVRVNEVVQRVVETDLPLLYLNQVGGQDELVFDGASFGLNADRSLAFQAKSFEEQLIMSDWAREDDLWVCAEPQITNLVSEDEAPWRACVLGLRDYIQKNHFKSVVLGLSGGIDSAIVAAMAVDALGADNVHCIMLPYRYTSEESLKDAKDCAQRLGVRYDIVSIGDGVEAATSALAPLFAGLEPGLAEENLQSRMRGTYLMGVSNKLGSMLITTGNKSEMAVGYATIYGDMNGGYNPIKDLYKMQVYHLAEWRNNHMPQDCWGPKGEVIPQAIISKAPSAELREDQTDQDSLPPYPMLDAILQRFVEGEESMEEIIAEGFDAEIVAKVQKLLYIAEYKRRQSAPGPKLTAKAFGFGRKYPITNGYRDQGN